MVGLGQNLWPNVDIEDVADLYLVIFESIMTNPEGTGHGREGIYFGENGEHKLYDVAKTISQALVDLGRGKSTEPSTFTKAELDKYLDGSSYLGSNARCKGNRGRALGWKPVKTTADMLASLKPEVEAMIRKQSASK